jgi:hypothetical protein
VLKFPQQSRPGSRGLFHFDAEMGKGEESPDSTGQGDG